MVYVDAMVFALSRCLVAMLLTFAMLFVESLQPLRDLCGHVPSSYAVLLVGAFRRSRRRQYAGPWNLLVGKLEHFT